MHRLARRRGGAAAVVAACALSTACAGRAAPLEVSVAFVNTWRVAGETLSAEDRAIVERTALDTLRRAFDGFAVRFDEGIERDRRASSASRTRRTAVRCCSSAPPASHIRPPA